MNPHKVTLSIYQKGNNITTLISTKDNELNDFCVNVSEYYTQ